MKMCGYARGLLIPTMFYYLELHVYMLYTRLLLLKRENSSGGRRSLSCSFITTAAVGDKLKRMVCPSA